MPAPPWNIRAGIDAVVADWQSRGVVAGCFTAQRQLEAEQARFAELPDDLTPSLVSALAKSGIRQLYQHQRVAIDAARADKHLVIATPTASGKSLCFHLPVLDAVARDDIHGMVHCSGGAQSKVGHFLSDGLRVVKDNMFPVPPLFRLIQECSGTQWREMYKVFNCGHRLVRRTQSAVASNRRAYFA